MLSQVLNIGRESVDGIGLVVDHTDAAVSLVHCVSADDVVTVVLLPGALVVSGAVVLHSVLVRVGNVALLRGVVLGVVVVVHVDMFLEGGQSVDELLGEQHLLDGEQSSGHAEQAEDKGDL